ncbi:Putative ribonuclease H protein At1g65750, partial [Linum perenne]
AENLSLTGRVTLATSVLNSIPSFVMQTTYLPVSLCDQIDRKIRNFIWGSTDGARKIHNVNWQTVCKPKCMGGFGLRSARELNEAFLMKIAWGVFSRPGDLWVKVLLTKYMKHSANGMCLKRRSGYSAIWRGVLSVWEETLNGLQWSIRNGRRTKFWTDVWLDSGVTLIDFPLNIQGVNPSISVGGMIPPRSDAGEDFLVWGLEENGKFSIKSAYGLLKDFRLDEQNGRWQKVWKWKGPNRIKHFMWIVMHGKLLTNTERNNRAAAGGIIRDCGGNYVSSYAINLGSCSIMRAELRGIIEGMKIAWDKGIRRLCIQTDSQAAVLLLTSNDGRLYRHMSLVEQFLDWRNRDWEVLIQHVYCEANNVG